jgi:hypothetical protein
MSAFSGSGPGWLFEQSLKLAGRIVAAILTGGRSELLNLCDAAMRALIDEEQRRLADKAEE